MLKVFCPTSNCSGWTWTICQGSFSPEPKLLSVLYLHCCGTSGVEGSCAEQSVHICQMLCAGLACWIKYQLNLSYFLILWRGRHVRTLHFDRQLEKGLLFLTVIVILQGDVVAVYPIRYLPSFCQSPLPSRFWTMGDLTSCAVYALVQEQKAEGLSMVSLYAVSHCMRC